MRLDLFVRATATTTPSFKTINTLTASYHGKWRKAGLFTFYQKLHGDIINRSVIFCNQFIVHLHNIYKIHG